MPPRSESFSLFASCPFTDDSNTDVADAQRRAIVVIAIGHAQERCEVVEPAAAHDWKVVERPTQGAASRGGSSSPPGRIDCGTVAVIVGGVRVGNPLAHIAEHVMYAPGVGRLPP